MRALLNNFIRIGSKEDSIQSMLNELCNCIITYWVQPNVIGVQINYNGSNYCNSNFTPSVYIQKQDVVSQNNKIGEISIYYKNQQEAVKLFSDDLFQLATLLSGFIAEKKLISISHDYGERLKELRSITKTSDIFKQQKTLQEKLQEICN